MQKDKKVVAIIGMGPAGLMAAYELSSKYEVLLIDKGSDINSRHCPIRDGKTDHCVKCKNCAIMSGFGGAGSFSDSKLSLTSAGVGGELASYVGEDVANFYIQKVDKIYAKFDKNKDERKIIGNKLSRKTSKLINDLDVVDIKYTKCPTKHLGTDGTLDIMKRMQNYLASKNNVHMMWNTSCEKINKNLSGPERFSIECCGIDWEHRGKAVYFVDYVILAPGRSGNLWLKSVCEKLGCQTKKNKVDIGVRLETAAENLKELTDGLYDVKLSYTDEVTGNKIRTFCTNPNGFVSEEHYDVNEKSCAVANGHSFSDKKSNMTNMALLVTLNDKNIDSQFLEKYLELVNQYSKGHLIKQGLYDFVLTPYSTEETKSDKSCCTKQAVSGDLNVVLPHAVATMIKNFIFKLESKLHTSLLESKTSWLYAPEIKFYSDCVLVKKDFETIDVEGLYVAGDGSGITRGITQSASMGLIIAEHLNEKVG